MVNIKSLKCIEKYIYFFHNKFGTWTNKTNYNFGKKFATIIAHTAFDVKNDFQGGFIHNYRRKIFNLI
jgi:hypothetical protein